MKGVAAGTILVSFCLGGCGVIHLAKVKGVADDVKECTQEAQSTPGYAELSKNHFLPNFSENGKIATPTEAQILDAAYPTDEEANSLIVLHNKHAECRRVAIEGMADTVPGVIPMMIEKYKIGDLREINLIQKKITWGESAGQYAQSLIETVPKLQKAFVGAEKDRDREIDESLMAAGHVAGKVASVALEGAILALSAWSAQQSAWYRNSQFNHQSTRPAITDCTLNSYGYNQSSAHISCTNH